MKIFKKAKRGFTLVELVVVIAVIAILAAVSVGAYFGVTESANKSKLEQESKQFHTAIQTVALRGNADYTLDADGLRVSDIDAFELALEGSMGQDVEVLNNDPTYIAKQTIVLKTSELVKSEEGAPVVYKTFEYYTAEISGKKIAVDVVTGDFAHANSDVVINKDGADVTNSTMFFKAPSFKTHVYAYLFSGEDENVKENAPYPGVELKTFAKVLDIYAFESSSSYEKVVFSWKDAQEETIKEGNKTEDIALPAAEANTPYYENGWKALPNIVNAETTGKTVYINEWATEEKIYAYAFTYNDEKNADWPGVEMTVDTTRMDKLRSYTFDKDYYTVIFSNGTDAKHSGNIELNGLDLENNNFYNVADKIWTTIPEDAFDAPTSVGLMTKSNSWSTEIPFSSADQGKTWTLENQILVTDDEFKVRLNNDWNSTIDFSELSEEDKTMFVEASSDVNIKVVTSAYYTFTFDALTNTLDITKGEDYQGEAPFTAPLSVGLIGSFEGSNWETDVDFVSDADGKVWTLANYELKTGDLFKVRLNDVWGNYDNGNYGYDHLSENALTLFAKASGTDGNVEVIETANYTFAFNAQTNEIDAEKLEPVVPEHTHTFDNNGPTCDDETCDEPNPNYVPPHEHSFNNNGPTCDDETCNEPNPNYVTEPEVTLTIASTSTSMNINELGNSISITDSRTEGTHSYTYEVTESQDILDVDANGKITAKANGTATIKVKDASNDSIESNEITVTVSNNYRLYFMNDWKWSKVYAHIWEAGSLNTDWSNGTELTNILGQYNSPNDNAKKDVYFIDLPMGAKVLFKDAKGNPSQSKNQTEDLTSFEVGKFYYIHWKTDSSKNPIKSATLASIGL